MVLMEFKQPNEPVKSAYDDNLTICTAVASAAAAQLASHGPCGSRARTRVGSSGDVSAGESSRAGWSRGSR
jgi:hypothetical protein